MKRAICTAITFAASMSVGWYAGVDLTQRGGDQAFVLMMAYLLAMQTWICPIWPKDGSKKQEKQVDDKGPK